jgi:peptidoglycan/LPS O-acetylase OafA/YrhL
MFHLGHDRRRSTVRPILTLTAVAVAAADLGLGVISWKRRSVLPGLLAVLSIPVVAFSVFGDPTRPAHEAALVIAAIMLVVAIALYGIGQAIQRLLDSEPDDRGRT